MKRLFWLTMLMLPLLVSLRTRLTFFFTKMSFCSASCNSRVR